MSSTNKIKRICLWSGPRNISTTLMYSFAQRQDTLVFDEPLYAYYLKNTNAKEYHPGADDILASMENDGKKVVNMMLTENKKQILFFKHMTKHLLNLNIEFMKDMLNVILIRDPKEMLPSFAKVIPNPTMDDVGYEKHIELMNYFDKNAIKYVVLDSKKVLLHPEKILIQLCELLNIPFNSNMLHWKAQQRKEDGIWAKYWYNNIHKSTGFIKYNAKTESFPKHLKPLLEDCIPHYNKLLEHTIG